MSSTYGVGKVGVGRYCLLSPVAPYTQNRNPSSRILRAHTLWFLSYMWSIQRESSEELRSKDTTTYKDSSYSSFRWSCLPNTSLEKDYLFIVLFIYFYRVIFFSIYHILPCMMSTFLLTFLRENKDVTCVLWLHSMGITMGIIIPCIVYTKPWVNIIHSKIWVVLCCFNSFFPGIIKKRYSNKSELHRSFSALIEQDDRHQEHHSPC